MTLQPRHYWIPKLRSFQTFSKLQPPL